MYQTRICYFCPMCQRRSGAGGDIRRKQTITKAAIYTVMPLEGMFSATTEKRLELLRYVFSGNNPGIQCVANLAGKASRKGARIVAEISTPRSVNGST